MNELDQMFQCHMLAGDYRFYTGQVPEDLVFSEGEFEAVWNLHPDTYHVIATRGGMKKTPRWQQAYGEDYHYTGRVNKALPLPALLSPLVRWAQENVDDRLNGVLLNWYDGRLEHYIGKHRDSTTHMVAGAPIVTVSFGEQRVFRLRPWRQKNGGYLDFPATNGSVFVMPYDTNLAFTHEIPHFSRFRSRRISVTLRAFLPSSATERATVSAG
jgi:alkylated DNA repair dioxygenase AlkB